MLGRIVIYSISGCPHCLAAKATLKEHSLEFLDIGLDKFQPHVREWVEKTTGKTSVPQIFFNSEYVGGNHELQEKWADSAARSSLMDILENEFDENFPLVPDTKDSLEADNSGGLQDPVLEALIEAESQGFFKPEKKGLICGKTSGRGCRASDLLSWLMDKKGFEREKALDTVEKLLERQFLKTQDLWNRENIENTVLYRYETSEHSESLNSEFPVQPGQVDASKVALQIRKLILKLFSEFISDDGKFVDYKGMAGSLAWQEFKFLVSQLQDASLSSLSREERLAFFINMYNVLVIHGTVVRGVPTSMYARYKFFSSVSYTLGGLTYSLNDIENGVLRNNRRSMGTLYMKPFSAKDPRLELAIDPVDARIHFALNCGAKSCPPIKTFSAPEVDKQLNLATRAFLENDEGIKIDSESGTIHLSQLFNWYQQDFGDNKGEVLDWISNYLTEDKASTLEDVRIKCTPTIKYLHYDWGNNEKKT